MKSPHPRAKRSGADSPSGIASEAEEAEESSVEDQEIVSDDEQTSESESGSDRRGWPIVELDTWLLHSWLNPASFAEDGERPRWLPEQIRTGPLTRRERAVIDRVVRGILRLGGDPLDFVWLFRTLLPGRFTPLDGEIAEAVVRAGIEPGESSRQTTSGTSLPGHRFQLLEALARQALYERVAVFHPVELEAWDVRPTGTTLRAFEAAVEDAVGGEQRSARAASVEERRGSRTRESISRRRAPIEDDGEGEDGRWRCSGRKSISRGMTQKPRRDDSGRSDGDGPLARSPARSPGGAVRGRRGPAAAPAAHPPPPGGPSAGRVIDQWDFTCADAS
jgi:hypothetical protein